MLYILVFIIRNENIAMYFYKSYCSQFQNHFTEKYSKRVYRKIFKTFDTLYIKIDFATFVIMVGHDTSLVSRVLKFAI